MITPEVIAYVQTQLNQGSTPDTIAQNLLANGWQQEQINQIFFRLGHQSATSKLPQAKGNLFPVIIVVVVLILMIIAGLVYARFTPSAHIALTPTPIPTLQPTITQQAVTPTPSYTDCGIYSYNMIGPTPINKEGINCFIKATETCSQAKLEINGSLAAGGDISTIHFDIQGMENGKCSLRLKQGSIIPVATLSTVPEAQQQQIIQAYQQLVGTEGVCLFNSSADLTELFTNWKNGTFSVSSDFSESDFRKADCSGPYFAQYQK